MITNLQKALRQKNITLVAYADFLGISQKTLNNKINEQTAFTYPEVKKTVREMLPEYSLEYLFASDTDDRTKQPA
ncbi:MAG: DNA-binding protein [Clostridium sp.]|jgi:hypothetical protein|nr:DNA-binding protein [Clostridium sp.]